MAQTYTRFKTMANFVSVSERLDMYGLLLLLAKVSHSTAPPAVRRLYCHLLPPAAGTT